MSTAPQEFEPARKFKGVWIPAEVWLDRSLSITEKVMLIEIDSLQDPIRGCFSSNKRMAAFFGLSQSRVSEIITGLAKKGLVSITLIRDGKRVIERQIRMVSVLGKPNTPSENAANPIRKTEGGYSEKAQESNTGLSNTDKNNTDKTLDASVDEEFENAWKLYPKREGSNPKNKAHAAWKARVKAGVSAKAMIQGAIRYRAYCIAKGSIGTEYVMQAQRFFGPGLEFENEWAFSGLRAGKFNPLDPKNHPGGAPHDNFDGETIDGSATVVETPQRDSGQQDAHANSV